ncbi:IPT/TIG domain-containing protein [Dyadobacter psychrotolerans]|uniref:Cell shape-determining protein MreB n=1 Tax=Dyadobacter psychrotolerans TaxID=2541721 RepID=A0A4V2Z3B5_9BACT|nr:IPT/TIG domain-containing protein [Dyadobacter psychrotolerans]TDE12088.1 cell shape-determining protein MreB [Dyadobacter psychrotolerans]
MNIIKNRLYFLFLLGGMFAATTSCKNDDTPTPVEEVLAVKTIVPASGPVGTKVVITGTKFDATPANNTVLFNTTPATVTAATTTSLEVTVPAGATSGLVSVTVGGKTVKSASNFDLAARAVVEKQGNITASETWTKDKIYLLKGFVYVTTGATLTIEPGTVIKGGGIALDPAGLGKGGTLIINAGAKIMAVGTAAEPIVFTSNAAPGARKYGDWGGLVIIGKAPHNQLGSKGPEGGISGQLGTDNIADDNSGKLQYVRVEFPGIALTAGNEINGITFYAVGSGTTVDHVQVSYSGDDSYEWFGGTVNAKNLVAFRGFDDDWDTDWGFVGKVQYALSLRDPEYADQSGSNGFESDNFAGTGEPATAPNNGFPLTAPVFANVSNFVFPGTPNTNPGSGSGLYQSAMHLRRNTDISIYNSVFSGYPEGLRLDGANTLAHATAGTLDLKGIVLANTTISVRGDRATTGVSDAQALAYFSAATRKNTILTDASTLLLNADNFKLTAPKFLPQATSPLLKDAVWEGKGADAFFTKELFRGAFGTTDWTTGWTNFDPQNTPYN